MSIKSKPSTKVYLQCLIIGLVVAVNILSQVDSVSGSLRLRSGRRQVQNNYNVNLNIVKKKTNKVNNISLKEKTNYNTLSSAPSQGGLLSHESNPLLTPKEDGSCPQLKLEVEPEKAENGLERSDVDKMLTHLAAATSWDAKVAQAMANTPDARLTPRQLSFKRFILCMSDERMCQKAPTVLKQAKDKLKSKGILGLLKGNLHGLDKVLKSASKDKEEASDDDEEEEEDEEEEQGEDGDEDSGEDEEEESAEDSANEDTDPESELVEEPKHKSNVEPKQAPEPVAAKVELRKESKVQQQPVTATVSSTPVNESNLERWRRLRATRGPAKSKP